MHCGCVLSTSICSILVLLFTSLLLLLVFQVINFDLPASLADYVHRVGRTGRAGQSGLAVTLVSAPVNSFEALTRMLL